MFSPGAKSFLRRKIFFHLADFLHVMSAHWAWPTDRRFLEHKLLLHDTDKLGTSSWGRRCPVYCLESGRRLDFTRVGVTTIVKRVHVISIVIGVPSGVWTKGARCYSSVLLRVQVTHKVMRLHEKIFVARMNLMVIVKMAPTVWVWPWVWSWKCT
jgi:hypothetical protein